MDSCDRPVPISGGLYDIAVSWRLYCRTRLSDAVQAPAGSAQWSVHHQRFTIASAGTALVHCCTTFLSRGVVALKSWSCNFGTDRQISSTGDYACSEFQFCHYIYPRMWVFGFNFFIFGRKFSGKKKIFRHFSDSKRFRVDIIAPTSLPSLPRLPSCRGSHWVVLKAKSHQFT